jgi:hypothetical protein
MAVVCRPEYRPGKTYANVHSMTSPGGEIRGPIHDDEKKRKDD